MNKICHCEICGESFTLTEDQAEVAIVTRMDDGSEHEYKVCDACFAKELEPLMCGGIGHGAKVVHSN